MRKKYPLVIPCLILVMGSFNFGRSIEVSSVTPGHSPFSEKDHFISKSIPVRMTPGKKNGKLELWQDKALQNRKQYAHQEPEDLSYNTTSDVVYKTAYLVLRSGDGTILDSAELYPWAVIEERTDLDGTGRSIYLVTTDMDNGNPYIMGPYTSLVVVRSGHLSNLRYKDAKTGKEEDISLSKCRRGYWKLVPSPGGKGKEIWNLWCENYAEDNPPQTHYQKYDFDGHEWIMKEKVVHRFYDWYVDDPPSDSVFEKIGK
jgi:hypothetical protein